MTDIFHVQAPGGNIRGYEEFEISGFEMIDDLKPLPLIEVSGKTLDWETVSFEFFGQPFHCCLGVGKYEHPFPAFFVQDP